jgi:hypothetical protein
MLSTRRFARRTACLVAIATMSVASSAFGYTLMEAADPIQSPATTSVGVE